MTKGLARSLGRNPVAAPVVKQVIPFNALAVAVAAVSTAVGFGTAIVGDLPEGNILLLGAVAYVQVTAGGTNATATFDGDFSIGSAPTADVTLSGSEVDIIASSALGAATARVSPLVRATNATQVILDNTDGSLELNLNLLIDAANITDDTSVPCTVSGFLVLVYSVMGDD